MAIEQPLRTHSTQKFFVVFSAFSAALR